MISAADFEDVFGGEWPPAPRRLERVPAAFEEAFQPEELWVPPAAGWTSAPEEIIPQMLRPR